MLADQIKTFVTKSTNEPGKGNSTKRTAAVSVGVLIAVVGLGIWLRKGGDRKPAPESDAAASSTNVASATASTAELSVASGPITDTRTNGATSNTKLAVKPDSPNQIDSKKEALLHEARDLIDQKKFDQAIEQLDAAINSDSKFAIAYMLRGHAYERQAKLTEALADFDRAAEQAKVQTNSADGVNLGELWEWRGEVHLQQTNATDAIEDFSRAIAKYAQQAAMLTVATNAADQASTNTITNTDTNRVVDLPYVMRGYAYLIAGQPTNALTDLDYWIKRHENDPLGYFYRGQVRVALEQPDAAVTDFSRTIELDKNYIGAWEFRGGVRYRQGDYVAALDDFQTALKLSDKSEYAARMGGWSAFKLGKLQLTVDLLSRALKLNPDNAVVYEDRGSAYAQLEQWTNALADYTKAVQYDPHAGRLQFYRANFQLCLGKMDEALSTAEKALRDSELNSAQRYYLIILTSLGSPNDADVQQRLKKEVLPEKSDWPAPIIRLLRGEIDYGRAVEATSDEGQRDELHTYAGWQLLNAGRVNDGRALLQKMVREGDRRLFEYHIARFLLNRTESAERPAAASVDSK